MFLDRLIDRLAGEGPVLKPTEALAEELADPIWETSPHDEVKEAPEPEEFEPQPRHRIGRNESKAGNPPATDKEPLVTDDPLVQFEPSEQDTKTSLTDGKPVTGRSVPPESMPPRQPRTRRPQPTEATTTVSTAQAASATEKRPVPSRSPETEKVHTPVVHLLPPISESSEAVEKPTPPTRPDPPVPMVPDNAGIEVTVHIGQIETAAPQPSQSPPKPAVRRRAPRPLLSLQDYLENRRRGAQ